MLHPAGAATAVRVFRNGYRGLGRKALPHAKGERGQPQQCISPTDLHCFGMSMPGMLWCSIPPPFIIAMLLQQGHIIPVAFGV